MGKYQETIELLEKLPEIFTETREREKTTRKDAATEMGINPSVLYYFENKKGSTTVTLLKVLRWLDDGT